MFSENNRITGRQMYRLMTYDLLGIGTLLVPQMLAKAAGRDGILSIGIRDGGSTYVSLDIAQDSAARTGILSGIYEAAAGKNRGRNRTGRLSDLPGAACGVCGISVCRHYSQGSSARRIVLSGPFGYHAAGAVWTCGGNRGEGESL